MNSYFLTTGYNIQDHNYLENYFAITMLLEIMWFKYLYNSDLNGEIHTRYLERFPTSRIFLPELSYPAVWCWDKQLCYVWSSALLCLATTYHTYLSKLIQGFPAMCSPPAQSRLWEVQCPWLVLLAPVCVCSTRASPPKSFLSSLSGCAPWGPGLRGARLPVAQRLAEWVLIV